MTAIPYRGVVEGFYGRPWSMEARAGLVRLMLECGLNLYIYGPKNDPYHFQLSLEPYPEEQARAFRPLLELTRKGMMHFCWAVHLGAAIRSPEELQEKGAALLAKLESMYGLGFRDFACFFDDAGTPDGRLHARICNFIIERFLRPKGDCGPLFVCPNIYWGDGLSQYCQELGEDLAPGALIFWSGQTTCCDPAPWNFSMAAAAYRRPPALWYNWPVNDYRREKIHLGRCYGLAPLHYSAAVMNPMENLEASKPAILQFARWAANMEGYDSRAAYADALARLYPQEVAAAMAVFAAHNSCPGPNEFAYTREESVFVTDFPAEFRRIREAVEFLKWRLPQVAPALYWELEGWLDVQECQACIGMLAEGLASARESRRQEILAGIAKLRGEQAAAGERAREKFAAATFPEDARGCVAPQTGTVVLEPRIRKLLEPYVS